MIETPLDAKAIEQYVMRYLQTLGCDILEKTPHSITVKLSPEADKELTNRPYYWSFVERTDAPPETMTFKFVFDPAAAQAAIEMKSASAAQEANTSGTGGAGTAESILGRYLGFVPTQVVSRIPEDALTFGSHRLEQIFQSARARGRFARLFEEATTPTPYRRGGLTRDAYDSWLCVNYKVELECDMKRSELHSLGFNLTTGEIRENFYESLLARKLTPRIPAGVTLPHDRFTLAKGASLLEAHIENKLRRYDHTWADSANKRLADELSRIQTYYDGLIDNTDELEAKEAIELQYRNRMEEIDWQYRPRIQLFAINCGLFHLHIEEHPPSLLK
ncbi:hypothetical protein E0485_22945 [Paenibacillus albiflavus]|uniref:Uncharacterized protein n=1 Tax=Paenibacillus albiflavus TaxID=2545760 RepID=A0A4R4DYT5_9BACL|nr:YqhG family protein [Paenibacillus albiflavus]TCZ70949.1 hypothetical protein E0485_22945 [Paenibacillus albiflavus]